MVSGASRPVVWRFWRGWLKAGAWCLCAVFAVPAPAEPMVAPGDKVKARQLRLAERGGEPGQWGRVQLRLQGDREQRVFVRGVNVAAPLSVQVVAEHTDRPVRVSLHRHAWAQAQAEGTTEGSGLFRFDGRAHGDVGVKLVSLTGEPVRATVLFWQGEPVPRSLAAVYAAPGTERAAQAGMVGGGTPGSNAVLWAALALGALLVGAAGWWWGRRARSPAAWAVLVLMTGVALAPPGPVRAQPAAPNPFDVQGWKPPGGSGSPKEPKDNKAPEPPPKDAPAGSGQAPNPFEGTEGWKPPADGGTPAALKDKDKDKDASAETPKDPAGADSGAAPEPDTAAVPEGDYRERIAAAENHARELAQQVARNRAEIERLKLLLESDRDAEPQPDRFPPMPLSCRPPTIEGDGVQRASEADAAWAHFERCQQCYAQPLADFERQLQLYEQLRVLYSGTRDYVTKVIDLGDKLPKPHTLLESAWAAQKLSIRQSFDGTKKAYDAKLIEFNDRLADILDRIGRCETELNDNPMWRQTSGLFFHQTMANSYKRSD
jgi:hypothetical protein